ncbi:MAG: sigma-54 dependent transcriptional regulator [Planctomycetota bacterium]|nr:sigma-54 dependent transcriptional regulator [Planctomycetota bacterium]
MSEHRHTVSTIYRKGLCDLDTFIAISPAMQECLRQAREAARTDASLLITGETGTGKTLLAQAIHNASGRKDKPCVVIPCTALPDSLLESELFGHEKGAFTGADTPRKGRFEMAEGGTVVLDEISDISPAAQAKLLRVVEYKLFERLGGSRTLHTNARIIAITNRDLAAEVARRRFREDLYYRLLQLHVAVPPLRRRREDIPALCAACLAECAQKTGKDIRSIAADALQALVSYSWPGNVRELKALMLRAAMACEPPEIKRSDFLLPEAETSRPEPEMAGDLSLEAAIRERIIKVLRLTRGNQSEACRILGCSRPTLAKKIAEYHLDLAAFRASESPTEP